MGNKDCSILVTSCDAYRDIERPFVTLFRKYWPDCPFELVLVTETANGAASTADSDTPQFDRIHATGKGKNWCQMLAEALAQIETPYVLLLMNDYLLTSPVDTHGFQHRLAQAETFDAANLRLNPNPQGRIPWRDTDLLEYPKNTAYCVTCQTGIWNKSYLMKLAQQNKSAWEFERFGSFMVGDEKRPLLVTRLKEFPFIDAVHKGYWEKSGIELCRRNGIPIDFTARGRPPFHVKVREAFKSLIFAIFPWTFIVRLQNLFNIGMKERPRPTAAQTPSNISNPSNCSSTDAASGVGRACFQGRPERAAPDGALYGARRMEGGTRKQAHRAASMCVPLFSDCSLTDYQHRRTTS